MNLFRFFNSNSKPIDISKILKSYFIDSTYEIKIPSNLIPYKSDRFRAKTLDKKIELSITNYSKPLKESEVLSIDDLKNQFLPLFDKFVNEGGYESNNDNEIGNNYIYQSFKVDNETQYYLYTQMIINNIKVIPALIIKTKGTKGLVDLRIIECMKEMIKSFKIDI